MRRRERWTGRDVRKEAVEIAVRIGIIQHVFTTIIDD